jgi:transposase
VRNKNFYSPRNYSTRAERWAVVQQFRQSGLTPRDFAAERQMTLSTLTRWLRDGRPEKEPAPRNGAVQFHSLALPEHQAWVAEVQQSNGALVRLQAGTPPDLAAALVRASR